MTELTIKLILILIPGILGTLVVSRFTITRGFSQFIYIRNAIIIGIFAYILLQLFLSSTIFIHNLFSSGKIREYKTLEVWNIISGKNIIPYKEVLGASFFGVILGFILTYIDRHKVIDKIVSQFNISEVYGQEPLYYHFLGDKQTRVVYIRHIKNNLTYYGLVSSWAEHEEIAEIALRSVKVYRYVDSQFLYEVSYIYLCIEKKDLIIENANIILEEAENKNNSKDNNKNRKNSNSPKDKSVLILKKTVPPPPPIPKSD